PRCCAGGIAFDRRRWVRRVAIGCETRSASALDSLTSRSGDFPEPLEVGLAGREARHSGDDHEPAWHLVAGDVLATVVCDVVKRDRCAIAHLNHRGYSLAEALHRGPDYDAVLDARDRLDDSRDLFREDLLAPRVDRPAAPAEEGDGVIVLDAPVVP